MKTACALIAWLAIAFSVLANERSQQQIQSGIANAVERYAKAIACDQATVLPQGVLMLVAYKQDVNLPKYAVLWNGDIGCWGGSGSGGTHLAIATMNSGYFVVQPELSSPVVAFDSPVRYIRRIVSHTVDTLTLEGNEYGPDDPNSNPSIPVRFTLRASEKGDWKLIEKTRLAPASSN